VTTTIPNYLGEYKAKTAVTYSTPVIYVELLHATLEVQLRLYNGLVATIPEVPQAEFEAVIRALLNTPPLPLSDIPRKREPKHPKRKPAKKR